MSTQVSVHVTPALVLVLDLLRSNRAAVVDGCVARILETLPKYSLLDPSRLRLSVEAFVDEVLSIDNQQAQGLMARIIHVSKERLSQGFSLSDYLRALLVFLPEARTVMRNSAPDQAPLLAQGFMELETYVHAWASTAATVWTDSSARALENKNAELNRLNQRLTAHDRALSSEVAEVSRALADANEFNRRVIDSLSSGLMVVGGPPDRLVSMYTSRMEEIAGKPAEEVLGRPVGEAMADVQGLDVKDLVTTVNTLGRLPLTKMHLKFGAGRERAVTVQAQQMKDENGASLGTVVVVDDVTERELLIDQFSRYVSRDLVQRLLARAQPLGMGGERRVCTILFADIRGFTALAEGMTPEALHQVLNQYLTAMIDGIFASGGFIDKFVGDKVMALFASNRSPADNAASACRAAMAIRDQIRKISDARRDSGLQPIEVGIGINTGEVLLGNVGSVERMDFTAIGDAVNVADRLQSVARGGEILVGRGTAALVDERFNFADRGPQPVKGRAMPVQVLELRA